LSRLFLTELRGRGGSNVSLLPDPFVEIGSRSVFDNLCAGPRLPDAA